ncbi:MAG TPA: DNA mismatch repair protein MutS [Phycisphaerae bacterium]
MSDPNLSTPAASADATPAMRQYLKQKEQVGDALLLFRMGDFYETFYEDAKVAARVLGITLTSRNKGENPIPMAGIPYHALNSYLRRLVAAGLRVAISEQMEDPKMAKQLVQRDVVRIVTPGTLTEPSLLGERDDNFLAAVQARGSAVGAAVVELSSGRFVAYSPLGEQAAIDELVRLRPAEVLIASESSVSTDPTAPQERIAAQLHQLCQTAIGRRPPHEFSDFAARRVLLEHFGVTTLAGFGWEEHEIGLNAAGAILAYLRETQKTTLAHITAIRRHVSERYVHIDHNTWRSLEIERTLRGGSRAGSLLEAIDRAVHPMGARRLRQMLRAPLTSAAEITARQVAVEALRENDTARRDARATLKNLSDIERIAARVALSRATPRDLAGLSQTLSEIPALRAALSEPVDPLLRRIYDDLDGLEDLAGRLRGAIQSDAPATIHDGGIIADSFDAELDRLHAIGRDGQTWLAEYQKIQIAETGIPSLKVAYNSVFGYYLEVTNTHAAKVPPHYVRKQTVRNAERYITDELKRFEHDALTARERANELEARLFEQLRREVAQRLPDLQRVADAIALLDVLAGWAELAVQRRYVRPTIADGPAVHIVDGRHPVLEQALADGFVPNDCRLDPREARVLVITGPNMAGKSTYIRQVALLVLLAQTGCPVPAASMSWSLTDRIFARVGASDEITRGQSTFMVEMTEAANILNHATASSLVVLDELGRGTSTFDGLALAWAITEHLANRIGCRTLVATHYHELTELAELLAGVQNCNVAVREAPGGDGAGIIFLHKIIPGGTDKSYGIHVARLAGVPKPVLERSREILAELQRGFVRESQSPKLARTRTRQNAQMSLFRDPAEEIAAELSGIDLERLTADDALMQIRNWRARLADS